MEIVLLEIAGATTAMLYLFLISQRSWTAWPACIISSCLYMAIFWSSQLYAEAALQLFFIGMGVVGWRAWARIDGPARVVSLSQREHQVTMVIIAVLTLVLAGMLYSSTPAGFYALPDAFVLVGSIAATFLTVRRVTENWYYWMVINGVSALVYASKGIWLTCALGAMYLCLSVRGLMMWRAGESPKASE